MREDLPEGREPDRGGQDSDGEAHRTGEEEGGDSVPYGGQSGGGEYL